MKRQSATYQPRIQTPSFIYVVSLGLGLYLELLLPTQFFNGIVMTTLGLLVLTIGLTRLITAVNQQRKPHQLSKSSKSATADRHIDPVMRGMSSRFYVLVYIGVAIIFNSFWALVLMPLLFPVDFKSLRPLLRIPFYDALPK